MSASFWRVGEVLRIHGPCAIDRTSLRFFRFAGFLPILLFVFLLPCQNFLHFLFGYDFFLSLSADLLVKDFGNVCVIANHDERRGDVILSGKLPG